jgi:two-component system cell cycle sensor histidine kinase/response regulator CckA
MTLSLPQIAATPARILIVEDEGIVADHLENLLLTCGYEVVGIAESSADALAQVSEFKPDLILMDIRIKGDLDGIETTARLRDRFDIPVVYLTAHTDMQTVDRAKMTGAFGFLTKPIHQTSLRITVEMALHKHRADLAMRHQRSWMATVLGTMADAMAVIDSEGKIQFLNGPAESLTGWTNEQCGGMNIATVLPLREATSDLAANAVFSLPPAFRSPCFMPRDLVASKRSGERFPIEGAISTSVDNGKVVGAVITFRDATIRQAQESEIRHRDKMQAVGRLAAGIAHDFNNLLFVILGYTEEMLTTRIDDPGLSSLHEIQKAGKSAATLTAQLLKFSRKQPAEKQNLDLNSVIRDAEELFRRIGGPYVTWQFRLDPNLSPVLADQGQLKQILMNLVANSRDAMPGTGRIIIETANLDVPRADSSPEEMEHFIALSVTDTGTGMSPEIAEHLFEPFFTTRPPGGGTGLGLAIVHSIVTDHGGTIHVDSTPGAGATFTIYFPQAGLFTSPVATGDLDVLQVAGPATLLLVEDQESIRGLLRNYLISAGYNVLESANGEEALRIANEHAGPIDVLITDVMMPGPDGFEVAKTLTRRRAGIKVVFISGHAQEMIDGIENLPPDSRFLRKPFARNELLKKVNSLLMGRANPLVNRASV